MARTKMWVMTRRFLPKRRAPGWSLFRRRHQVESCRFGFGFDPHGIQELAAFEIATRKVKQPSPFRHSNACHCIGQLAKAPNHPAKKIHLLAELEIHPR